MRGRLAANHTRPSPGLTVQALATVGLPAARPAIFTDEPEGSPDVSQSQPVVHADPQILSGTPVFVGTRVPAQALFDYLEGGDTLDEFLRQFPSVTRHQPRAALDLARDSLLASARSA